MANIYRIGVSIAATNGVSSVLRVIQKDFFGLNKTIDLTKGKLTGLKLATVGAMTAMGGLGLLGAFKGLADAGGAVLNAQAKMLQVGISMRDVAQETAVAYQNIGIAGATAAGNINNLTTLRAVLGTLPAANAALPAYTQAQFALSSRHIDPGQLDQFVKALDIMGAFNTNGKIDPSKFGPAMQEAISAVLTTNGLLTGQGFYQAVRLSGPAASAMGEQAYLNNMVEILLALGNRGARGLEYGATTFLGGQMSKNSARMFDRLGLTAAADYTHEGGRWSLNPGKIAGSDMLSKGDIVGWIQKYFLPDASKAGLTPLEASATLPQTLQLLITTIANMTPQMARSVQQQAQARTVDPYQQAQASYAGATSNLSTAMTSLWQALGTPAAQMAVPILNSLTSGIRNFTQWLGDHQAAAKVVDATLLGLGAALTVLGTAAVGVAIAGMVGTGGTLAALALGVTTAAAVLTATNWKTIGKDFDSAITTVEHSLQRLVYDLLHPTQLLKDITAPTPGYTAPAFVPRGVHIAPGSGAHIMDDIHGAVSTISNWINAGAPTNATVTNPGDIAKSSSAVTLRNLHQGLSAPSTGSTGYNPRATPSGSAAMQMSGSN